MTSPLTILLDKVVQLPPHAIVQLGGIGDGSYASSITAIKGSQVFISGGISSNCEFEFDAYRQNPAMQLVMVDKSVSKWKLIAKGFGRLIPRKEQSLKYLYNSFIYLWLSKQGLFIPKFIDKDFTLHHIMQLAGQPEGRLLLKLDIEGAEYLLFSEIIERKTSLTQLSMEIHDFAARHNEVIEFINSLASHMSLVQLKVNDAGGFSNGIPKCIELTLLHHEFMR